MKRHHDEQANHGHKKQKYDSPHHSEIHKKGTDPALSQLPPSTSTSASVPAYINFTVPKGLPCLPAIKDDALASAPFKHKSSHTHYRSGSSTSDLTYERLEFLGDAYIELIATRLIDERFPDLLAGRMSQLRELLVKNETLAEFSRAYGFPQRVEVADLNAMLEGGKHQGNKGFAKVLGDVFEAYVAAVIKDDVKEGFARCEKWLTALWVPKLVEAVKNDGPYRSTANVAVTEGLTHGVDADPLTIYNPTAKAELQQRIYAPSGVKLSYEKWKEMVELKGDQIGQNRHFVALYLTGYGYERRLLGQGEGRNRVEAGNWAATQAMHGEAKGVVEECEAKLREWRKENEERKARKLAEREARNKQAQEDGERQVL